MPTGNASLWRGIGNSVRPQPLVVTLFSPPFPQLARTHVLCPTPGSASRASNESGTTPPCSSTSICANAACIRTPGARHVSKGKQGQVLKTYHAQTPMRCVGNQKRRTQATRRRVGK
eukprot:365333-Chlamydomonas_euryale.AAC.1